jgi:hypothetical protein
MPAADVNTVRGYVLNYSILSKNQMEMGGCRVDSNRNSKVSGYFVKVYAHSF